MNAEFVQAKYPEFYPVFIGYPEDIMRADAVRYLIMHSIGGMYLDLDYEMLKRFDLDEHALVLPHNRQERFGDRFDGLGNCIFASEPNHPFWDAAIAELHKPRLGKTLDDPRIQPYIEPMATEVEATTGPGFLTRMYHENREYLRDALLPNRNCFTANPQEPKAVRENTKWKRCLRHSSLPRNLAHMRIGPAGRTRTDGRQAPA